MLLTRNLLGAFLPSMAAHATILLLCSPLVAGRHVQAEPLSLVQVRASAVGHQMLLKDDQVDEELPELAQPVDDMPEWHGPGGCVDDMCSKSMRIADDDNLFAPAEPDEDEEEMIDSAATKADFNSPPSAANDKWPACDANPPPKMRSVLSAVVQAYHGSTALEEVLMSSEKVATLCSCDSWQCEAGWVKGLQDGDAFTWQYTQMLGVLSKCWDLDKPVLFQKLMLPEKCNKVPSWVGEDCQSEAVSTFEQKMNNAGMPKMMQSSGIQTLNRAYLLLWRPLCMVQLSSHSEKELKTPEGQMIVAKREVFFLVEMMKIHQFLYGRNAVMVVSLASLVWESDRNKYRLQKFMPCMGQIDTTYVPELDKDIFKNNRFKADGSVEDYGKSVKPGAFYNVEDRKCKDWSLLKGVDAELYSQAMNATEYLTKYS